MAQGGMKGATCCVLADCVLAGWALAGWALAGWALVWGAALAAPAPAASPLLPAVHFVPGSLLLPPPGPRPALRDTCGAGALSWLVGQPRSRIPVPVDLSHRRVSCTACVVASDVKLDRLDILYDARTNLVTRVTCG